MGKSLVFAAIVVAAVIATFLFFKVLSAKRLEARFRAICESHGEEVFKYVSRNKCFEYSEGSLPGRFHVQHGGKTYSFGFRDNISSAQMTTIMQLMIVQWQDRK